MTGLEAVIACPTCSRPNQVHQPAGDEPLVLPQPGDVCICWGCRAIAVYYLADPDLGRLGLRKPTGDELREALANPDVASALQAMAVLPTPTEAARATRSTP